MGPRLSRASSFALMQSKVWPIILFAVPSIIRAPTEASVPEMVTSADQSIVVGPSAGPDSAIRAVASTADPGAWPWALRIARSGGVCSAIVMSTVKRAEMNPTPTLALALKWSSSMTSMDSTPGPHEPDLVRIEEERPDLVARGGDLDGALELHAGLRWWGGEGQDSAADDAPT